jgi:hypothetical protein
MSAPVLWLRRRLGDERAFTMPAVLGVMLVVMLVSVAAIAAASGDIHLTRYDQDDKQAYAAAEAGVNDYLGHLNTDNNYWANCTNVPPPTPVNQLGATGSGRKWRTLPGSKSEYSIELVPAPGKNTCDRNDPSNSMVNDGNIKIRSTGHVLGTNNYRTINATFRRSGFLDYLYYTDFENQDAAYLQRNPTWGGKVTRSTDTSGNPDGGPTLEQWAADKCNRHWWGDQSKAGQGRSQKPAWRGQFSDGNGGWMPATSGTVDTDDICGEIQFVTGDRVNGPFHSNDDILVCGSPRFGRDGGNDRVEVSGNGWRPSCGGSSPVFNPSLDTKVASIDPPAANTALKDLADGSYVFTGQTTVTLNPGSITVKNANVNGGAEKTMPYPPNGIIYANNGACGARYNPLKWYVQDPGCGDVRVSGTYDNDLTIGADNDIIVTDDVRRAGGTNVLLGLIPNGFARIWHPVSDQTGSYYNTCTTTGPPNNVRVDAAILTLTGSFTVDNYWCGGSLGTLTVNGAIAQRHRGVVGQSDGDGYLKNYNYDENLRYRSPPHFLDPIQTSWRILRQGEQSPPARG